jgi:hypothetical protein
MLRPLIADGNDQSGRASRKSQTGKTSSEDYGRVVSEIHPNATCELIYPADADCSGSRLTPQLSEPSYRLPIVLTGGDNHGRR